ncbi:MAG TPA: hypothetical protein VG674_06125 [Amycolatopsis sp.]|nr:hypothetical protein [Amycolatopsis sp.]
MYDSDDPRARLGGGQLPPPDGTSSPVGYFRFHELAPLERDPASTWWLRAQNMVLGYSDVTAGAEFVRPDQLDEWMLLLPEAGTAAAVTAGGETIEVRGRSLVVVPPGPSEVRVTGAGPVVRLFTARNEELAALAMNATAFQVARPEVRPLRPWPAPAGGYRIRCYDLDVPPEKGRFGRIWRCSTMMVNYLEPMSGPRDVTTMSPHWHPDFEQITLALSGEHVHHMRWHWGTDLSRWRDDEHKWCPSPSAVVIPPPVIHTSQAVGSGVNQLVDLFCPPRTDFSAQPGWVLNADDYPMPDTRR